MAFAINL